MESAPEQTIGFFDHSMSEVAVMLRPAKLIFGDKGLGPRPQSEADWTLRDVLEALDRRKGKNWATVKRRIRYDYPSSETSHDVILLGRADEANDGSNGYTGKSGGER